MSLRLSSLNWRCLSCTDKKGAPALGGGITDLLLSFTFRFNASSSCPCLLSSAPKRVLLCRASLSSSRHSSSHSGEIPLLGSGVEDELVGYVFGKKKATDVAHSVWKYVVQRGDTVVDATCGNGYDTLAMVKLVADESGSGRVYGLDIQKDALSSTRQMLSESLSPNEEGIVELFPLCHSKMEEILPKDVSVRVVAFNLGYLPGGDKTITTVSETTLLALEAAARIIRSGGLISVIVYIGHPTGREEFETVQEFASRLSTDEWICCKLQMLNRPLAPVPIFMFRR